jgi:hypothetical protein
MCAAMASYAVLDRTVTKAVHDLHDFLWVGAKMEEAALLDRLRAAAKVLDAHLGTRAVSRGAAPLLGSFDRRAMGSDLFTFLWIVGHLAIAAERRRADPKEAVRRASEVVSSNAIHLASASGRFDLVEMFEAGKTDFDAFQAGLAEVLEDRGVLAAGAMRRLAVTVYDANATWRADVPKDAARIAATAAIGDAALHSTLLVEALRTLGRYRDAPYAQLAPALLRVLDAPKAHP